jgi:hydantoinase/carbamoylase family amidase
MSNTKLQPHTQTDLKEAGEQVIRWACELAHFSEEADALTVTYCSPTHTLVSQQLRDWMRSVGFDQVSVDAVGNVIARYAGTDPSARQLLTGSHFDTVRDGGRFDGRLGILAPMAAIKHLAGAGIRLPFDVIVIGFADEEGIRFQTSFLGSAAITGQFDPDLLERHDDHGCSMRDAMQAAGLRPDSIDSARFDASKTIGFVEWHIEQGPVLLERGLALGAVSAINGSVRMQIDLQGQSGHSGTTPMSMRRDAACAAAEFVLAVETRCADIGGLVGTVGRLEVPNGSVNVIPGHCSLSLDVRAPSDDVRDSALNDLLDGLKKNCQRRQIELHVEETMRVAATPTDPVLRNVIADTLSAMEQEPFELASGAGHDAMQFHGFCPLAMLFVRCGNGGISHSPLETMNADDAQLAVQAFIEFTHRLSAMTKPSSGTGRHD